MTAYHEPCTRTLTEVSALIEKREVSPVALTRAMLDRIAALDGELHGYLTVTADRALSQARAAEEEIARGLRRGPLHGVPVAVKDLCFTKGIRTTCGSALLADHTPDHDAAVVERLASAGAVLLGKLSMAEFALSTYANGVTPPVNPLARDRWVGVSSSGSAVATAASLCFGAIATDTGGSIRYPSAFCGVVGLKPTYGKVSRHGVFPLAGSLDHVGTITRTVADAAVMLQAIAGFDPRDPTTRRASVPDYRGALRAGGAKGLRVGVDERHCTEGVEPEVARAVVATTAVFEDLGATIVPVRIPVSDADLDDWGILCGAEAAAAHARWFPSRAEEYGLTFRAFLEGAAHVRAIDYVDATARRHLVRSRLDDLFQEVDVLLCQSSSFLPPKVQDMASDVVLTPEMLRHILRPVAPFNLTGSPTISLPCGRSSEGLSISLQLAARHDEEDVLLRAAHAYEQATR